MKGLSRLLEPISRLADYGRRHGFRATVQRAGVFVSRIFSSHRMVLFYFDFSSLRSSDANFPGSRLPGDLSVERKSGSEEMVAADLERIVNFWNPDLARRNIEERFREGASLWLIRSEQNLAGYGWSITGRTIAPHYHPLSANDVHLFDFLVFPEYRGRNINPSLVESMLQRLAADGRTRAYIEVREWNHAQLKSLAKTRFQRLGFARKVSLGGRTFVEWTGAPPHTASDGTEVPAQDREAPNHIHMVSH
jgi:ribosomal protein S18 acetylase RimI-like enzyme